MTMQISQKTQPFSLSVYERARRLFFVLIIALIIAASTTFVAGWKTGELQKLIIDPLKKTVQDFKDVLVKSTKEDKEASPSGEWKKYLSITPTIKVNVNIRQRININTQQSNGKSYEELKREQDQRWQQEQEEIARKNAESQRQFEDYGRKNQEDFEKTKQQYQSDYNSFVQENQQRLEEWKKQNGF